MERIDNLLPDAERAMSGSSASRRPQAEALKLDDKICPYCGRELQAEWVEFPPALQKKYDRPGEWYYHPCSPECETKNDRREWELMRRDARVAALKERSGLSKRMKGYALDNFDHGISRSAERAFAKVMDYIKDWQANQAEGRGIYFCGDVGVGKTHLAVAVMNELIFVIVNHRYREELPTIFTSNVGPRDLAAQLGERTASRIIAMCDWISLEGEDYREAEVRRGL